MPAQTPTRKTPEAQLDQWNDALRASPVWQQWMQQRGKIRNGQMVGLNDREQNDLERHLAQNGIRIPNGMHIDQGGNLNQKNRLLRNIGIGAAIGGGALTGLGLAGLGPLGGLGGGAAASGGAAGASGAAGGVLPSASIAGLHTAVPAAIGSQGVSAGLGGALGGLAGAGAAGAAGSGVAGLGNKLLGNLTTPGGIASLASIIPALLAGNGGGSEDPMDNEFVRRAYEDARRNNAMAEARYRRTDPLHEAVSQLAYSRLPVSARNGPLPRVTLPE